MDAPAPIENLGEPKRRYTTISIPQPLYEDVKRAIAGSGFRSATEFLVYVTRLSLQGKLASADLRPTEGSAR